MNIEFEVKDILRNLGYKMKRKSNTITNAPIRLAVKKLKTLKYLNVTKRFLDKVEKRGINECWNWKGAKQKQGYGCFKINGKLYLTHRVAYELKFGKIPNNLWILHKCDNPSCVNTNHLFSGTRSDNMKDAFNKGRLNVPKGKRLKRGDYNPFRKISENQALEIKNSQDKSSELARRFGVSKSLVYKIKSGLRRDYLSLSTATYFKEKKK